MPYKSKKVKAERKDRYRTKVGSVCGSEKLIPNCPLQGKKEFIGIHGTLRRTRTYPEYSGRVGANGSGRSGRIYKSASNDWINFPRFSKLKYGEKLPFVGCVKCTPWVVCSEHEAWLTIPGHANYTPIFRTQETPKVHGVSSTSTNETPVSSKTGPKAKKPRGHQGGRPKKNINETPKESFEEFEKRVDNSMKELKLNTPLNTPKTSRKRHTDIDKTPKSKKGKKSNSNNIPKNGSDETECVTLSSDQDEPMEIQNEKTLANKGENDCINLSSDEDMEVVPDTWLQGLEERVLKESLSTLNVGQWLNDEIINTSFQIIAEEAQNVDIACLFDYQIRSVTRAIPSTLWHLNRRLDQYHKIIVPAHVSGRSLDIYRS